MQVNILREFRHPHIVRYYDRVIARESRRLYIVMEYCEGGDLAQACCTGRQKCSPNDTPAVCKEMETRLSRPGWQNRTLGGRQNVLPGDSCPSHSRGGGALVVCHPSVARHPSVDGCPLLCSSSRRGERRPAPWRSHRSGGSCSSSASVWLRRPMNTLAGHVTRGNTAQSQRAVWKPTAGGAQGNRHRISPPKNQAVMCFLPILGDRWG